MTRRVVITGVGVLSPLGDTPESLHAALVAGESALGPIELFATDRCPGVEGGEIRGFEPKRYIEGNLRPLDRSSMLSIAAASRALDAAGWSSEAIAREGVGLVLGTMFGSIHTISEFDRRALTAGPNYASPLVFANTVINAAAGQTAIRLGLTGINSTIAGGKVSGLQAIAYASDQIASGRGDAILAGGVEELCFESLWGFWRAGLVAGSDGSPPAAIPYDARRNGFSLGEGGTLLMLEEAERARRREATPRGEILGHGFVHDPTRGGSAERAADAVARAIRIALADAGLDAGDVGCASTSADGSPAGDRAELRGIAAALARDDLPITAVASQTGETLGCSGALQALTALDALAHGELPGIGRWEQADPTLPAATLSAAPTAPTGPVALVTSLGLDGTAGALLLGAARRDRS